MVDHGLARSIIPKDGVLSTSICQVKPFEGAYLMGLLRELQARYPQVIKEVRGRGLMIGIEFHPPRDSVSALLRIVAEQDLLSFLLSGYLLNVDGIRVAPTLSANNTVRVEPSAYVSYQDLEHFCRSLER